MAAKKILVRGVALVEQVIAKVEAGDDDCGIEIVTPQPVDVAKLAFSNGSPLPPSLKRWLAFDGSWLMRRFGWDDALSTSTVARLVKESLSDTLHRAFRTLPAPLPAGDAMPLDFGSDSMRILFLGAADDDGEVPVLNVDVDDVPAITFEAPGFDTWLAMQAGIINLKRAPWSAVVKESRARVFGKKAELECTDFSDEDEPEEAPRAPKPKPQAKPFVIKPNLAEDKLGKGLVEALEGSDAARADAFFEAARTRFPEARQWGPIVLRHVVSGSDADLARRLFAANVRPNTVGPYGALFEIAAEQGSIEVVRAFLEAGVKVDLRSGSGQGTALIGACGKQRLDVATMLLDRGADPKLADNGKMAPLHHAASPSPDGPPVNNALCQLLLDRGAELDRQDGNGRTALHLAVETNNEPLVDLLLERRANPDLQQWAGDTALTLAHRHRRTAMVEKLRAAGARSDIKNNEGWSVDDVALAGVAGPKHLEVKLACGPGKHTAELMLDVSIGQAIWQPDLIVARFEDFATYGCAGSDVHAPWSGVIALKGGGIQTGQGRWELTYEGVAPGAFALWLRALLAVGWTVKKLSLIGTGETTIDTGRARALFANESLEPMAAWPDPGFSVIDKAKEPNRFAWVSTKTPIEKDQARALVSALGMLYVSLPRTSLGPESAYSLTAGGFTSAGFEIVIKAMGKKLVFPHDRGVAKALLVNALAKLHHDTDAIAGLEWGL